MRKGGSGFSAKVMTALALGAVGIGVVLALLAGYFLGHFTGHTKTTTVTFATSGAESGAAEEAPVEEAPAEEAEEAPAEEAEEAPAEEAEEAPAEEAEEAPAEEAPEAPAKEGGEAGSTGKAGGESSLAKGEEIVESNCASCHTLSEAGASGTVGPNLDQLKPSQELVEAQVTNGGGGMPAFQGTLSSAEIEAVAKYVSEVAGSEG